MTSILFPILSSMRFTIELLLEGISSEKELI